MRLLTSVARELVGDGWYEVGRHRLDLGASARPARLGAR